MVKLSSPKKAKKAAKQSSPKKKGKEEKQKVEKKRRSHKHRKREKPEVVPEEVAEEPEPKELRRSPRKPKPVTAAVATSSSQGRVTSPPADEEETEPKGPKDAKRRYKGSRQRRLSATPDSSPARTPSAKGGSPLWTPHRTPRVVLSPTLSGTSGQYSPSALRLEIDPGSLLSPIEESEAEEPVEETEGRGAARTRDPTEVVETVVTLLPASSSEGEPERTPPRRGRRGRHGSLPPTPRSIPSDSPVVGSLHPVVELKIMDEDVEEVVVPRQRTPVARELIPVLRTETPGGSGFALESSARASRAPTAGVFELYDAIGDLSERDQARLVQLTLDRRGRESVGAQTEESVEVQTEESGEPAPIPPQAPVAAAAADAHPPAQHVWNQVTQSSQAEIFHQEDGEIVIRGGEVRVLLGSTPASENCGPVPPGFVVRELPPREEPQ